MNTVRYFWLAVLAPIAIVLGEFVPMWILMLLAVIGIGNIFLRLLRL